MKRFWAVVGLLLIGGLLVLSYLAWTPERHHDADAIRQAASKFEARIIRDAYGVPHIYAERDADAAFGLGFAHAEDDWLTIQEVVALSRGELARYRGSDAARSDYLVRSMQVWPVVEARYESDLSAETKRLLEGYVAGLNLYAVDHADETWESLLPVTPQDVVAGFVFRTPFFFGLENKLAELFADERQQSIAEEPVQTTLLSPNGRRVELGSNGIAVNRDLSTDETVRLWVNSHQPFWGPVAWYEIRVKSEEGWDFAGGIFPGSPVMLHGHNRYLGWANAVNRPDLVDVYVLETDPDDPDRYRLDGQWRDLQVETAEIRVKLWGPFSWVFEREMYRSAHGPVFRTDHGDYAVRHAGEGTIRQVEQWYRLNKAETLVEWLDAMSILAIPSLHFIYADMEGFIGYVYNGRFPDRPAGWNWRAYLPGNRSDLIWTDVLDWADVPKTFVPPSGFLFNANNSPFMVTKEGENISPENFAAEMGIESRMTNRALRALDLFSADDAITRDEFIAYKFDKAYAPDSRMARMIDEITALDLSDDPALQAAQALLASWDMRATEDSEATALAVLAGWEVGAWLTNDPEWKTSPRQALAIAVNKLMTAHGKIDVPWGTVMRHRRGEVDEPIGGAPDVLRAIYSSTNLAEDGTLTAAVGDSLIMLVEWNDAGELTSHSIHPYGSATLDTSSPHYDDQARMFANQEFKRVPLELDELLAEASRDYQIGGQTSPE